MIDCVIWLGEDMGANGEKRPGDTREKAYASTDAFLEGSYESDAIASVASYREGATILLGGGPRAGGRDEIETLFTRAFE